jgi:hypothetical protein
MLHKNPLVTPATTASFLPEIHAGNENRVTTHHLFYLSTAIAAAVFSLPPPPIEGLERGLSEPKADSESDEFAEFSESSRLRSNK